MRRKGGRRVREARKKGQGGVATVGAEEDVQKTEKKIEAHVAEETEEDK